MATGPASTNALVSGDDRRQTQSAKLSRYRSLRGRSVSTSADAVGRSITGSNGNTRSDSAVYGPAEGDGQQPPTDAASGNPVSRSMSRYRRRANSVSVNGDATQRRFNGDPPLPTTYDSNPPIVPPVPAIPGALNRRSSGRLSGTKERKEQEDHDHRHRHHVDTKPYLDPPPSSPPSRRPQLRHTSDANSRGDLPPLRRRMMDHQSRPSVASDEPQELRRMTTDRDQRHQRLRDEQNEAARRAEDVAQLQAETNRILAEQKRKDLERLEAQLAKSQQAAAQAHKQRSPVIEKFALLTKGRKHKNDLSPGWSPMSSASRSVSEFSYQAVKNEPIRAAPTGIEVGGKGIVPQTDAPASAINSGDRTSKRVAYDLGISSSSCVVVESYTSLGLERRLRRYEHIRDVMNSWDQGSHNCLIIAGSESDEDDGDLDISSVPRSEVPPPGFQLYMYHSNRPGKWSKRWITLLDNGQIFCAKKPSANSGDKDATNLCRLSDYDIYKPTESQMRRHLKPPKKYCLAVKSQQKTTVFVNTENYVQLFSTDDPDAAAQFREHVHGWRSWYLVDRRPPPLETRKAVEKILIPKTEEKPPQITTPTTRQHAPKKTVGIVSANGHCLKVSVDETPYTIGEFEPLLDMRRFDKRLSQFGKDFLPSVPDASSMPGIPAHLKQQQQQQGSGSIEAGNGKPTNHRLIDTINSTDDDACTGSGLLSGDSKTAGHKLIDAIKSPGDDAFTGSGLLGEGYEERRRAHTETEKNELRQNGAHHHHLLSPSTAATTEATLTDGPSPPNKPPLPPPLPPSEPNCPRTSQKMKETWFPSALEHSARQRNAAAAQQRPSTSAGVVQKSRRSSLLGSVQQHVHARPPTSHVGSGGFGGSGSGSGSGSGRAVPHPNPLGSSPYLGPSSPVVGGSGGGEGGMVSHSNRREQPKPLVSLDAAPGHDTPPQWRGKAGRGVAVPEGLHHLVDLISVSSPSSSAPPSSSIAITTANHNHNNRGRQRHGGSRSGDGGGGGELLDMPPPPPRSGLRTASVGPSGGRPAPHSAPLPLSRTRSKSSGPPPPVPLRTRSSGTGGADKDVPPMPPLPFAVMGGSGSRVSGSESRPGEATRNRERVKDRELTDRGRQQRERERRERREREYKEREAAYNAVPGRTGTLKAV
ncbi:hypothetical protein DL764_009872 [Monosporascus ibericus]|uniref:PH domain-containing protein n=1 Tax=Monosporascus ibericus TaxID=155417 RepID=A0A4V1X8V1_9PEZI|nr:hypothetical protein DL764_009872 [Monosporascus ibericus]